MPAPTTTHRLAHGRPTPTHRLLAWRPRRARAGGAPFLLLLAAGCLLLASAARAHEGPPYPVLEDEPHPPWVVSVWTDPDVGIGTYYVMLAPPPGAALPAGTAVQLTSRPQDESSDEVTSTLVDVRRTRGGGETHELTVPYATRGFWDVEVTLSAGAQQARLAFDVEVTPPGLGRWDLLWFAAPFLAVGFLWAKVLLKRRQLAVAARVAAAGGDGEPPSG